MKINKKYKKILLLIFAILLLFCVQTIVYSAINGTMTIKGSAYARVESDVRITDFRLASVNNASSNYEEFGKNHIVSGVELVNSSSTITYFVEITNYGSSDVGIFDITGLPSGVNYVIKDYNLHDKICDETGKCNNFIKKTYEIIISTISSYSGNIQMNFDFRNYHKINYNDIENKGYPVDVIDGGTLKITFKEDLKRVQFFSNNSEIFYYKNLSNNQTITINNVFSDIDLKTKDYVARVVKGAIDEIGSEVCISNECFHVISNDGTTVTMISKYNLYVGGTLDENGDHWTSYGDEATGLQDPNMRAYYEVGKVRNGVTMFSSDVFWNGVVSKFPSYVYGSSADVYTHVENYKNYLIGLDVEINNARLISFEELETLGCSAASERCTNTAYSFIYYTTYWTGSAASNKVLYRIVSDKRFTTLGPSGRSGVRPVIELPVEEVGPLVRVVNGIGSNVGDEVCIGDECFNIISSDADSITMLSKYNLYVGNECSGDTSSSCTAYGSSATGKQAPNMIGYGTTPRRGTMAFSNTNYWSSTVSSYPSYVYNSSSTLYSYVENYKTYLSSLGITVNEARLIKKDELESLGCSNSERNCSGAPSWIHSTTYWTGTAYASNILWTVGINSDFDLDYASNLTNFGCRPVIKIPKF